MTGAPEPIDLEKVATAADAGEPLPGLRQALAEANATMEGAAHEIY